MPVAEEITCAASALLAPLLTGRPRRLRLVAATRVSRHYETGDPLTPGCPTLSVLAPEAVRLPDAVVLDAEQALPHGDIVAGALGGAGTAPIGESVSWLRVTRWWRAAKPSRLAPPPDLGELTRAEWRVRVWGVPALHVRGDLEPLALLGAGPGLTPAGDDVLAAALVTARATADPRLPHWCARTRHALDTRSTTVVSRGLLTHALQGYAVPPLADFLTAVCAPKGPRDPDSPDEVERTLTRLLGVGHSSGAALATGVLHTLGTRATAAAA
ncbi:MAG: DUF2877 domain-containing protein [Nocardioidaceae bacterium]